MQRIVLVKLDIMAPTHAQYARMGITALFHPFPNAHVLLDPIVHLLTQLHHVKLVRIARLHQHQRIRALKENTALPPAHLFPALPSAFVL